MRPEGGLPDLIEEAYGADEACRHLSVEVSRADLERAAEAGLAVLSRSASIACACTHLSAMWTAILRDALTLPAYCVTGDLRVRGRIAFGSSDPAVARSLSKSNTGWDAHCWVSLGRYIGDASIFRTAYAQPPSSNLRRAVIEQFGLGRGLFLMLADEAIGDGLEYIPKYVVPEEQITGLIRGAAAQGLM